MPVKMHLPSGGAKMIAQVSNALVQFAMHLPTGGAVERSTLARIVHRPTNQHF